MLLLCLGFLPAALAFPILAGLGTAFPISSTLSSGLSKLGVDGLSLLTPSHLTWTPPGPGDLRAPCPGLNTLANHGFIPHDGREITLDIVQKGFKDAMNFDESVSAAAFKPALSLNPGASFINLDMLNKHNFIEHDGSLSRRDMYIDPSNRFDKDTFDAFMNYFGDAAEINTTTISNARARHALEMSRINPNFTLPQSAIVGATGESAFMLTVFGSPGTPVAKKSYVDFFFRNERLPVELGWTPVDTPITLSTILQIANDIASQTPSGVPLTYEPKTSQQRRGLTFGHK
ncbi:Peroxidase, family 2-domain-containing protein [Colletotrichum cereale]|nr:Peroxidase, family 2-domain-containing protein [Colletotrichum cereale]